MILSCWGQIAYLISVQHCQTNTPDSLSKLILLWYYYVRIAFLMHILLWVWVFWSGFKRQEDTSLRHIYDSWRTKASIGERFERDGGKTKRLFFLPYSLNLALWLADGGTNKSQVQVFLIQGALPSASSPAKCLMLDMAIYLPKEVAKFMVTHPQRNLECVNCTLIENKCEGSLWEWSFISNDLKARWNKVKSYKLFSLTERGKSVIDPSVSFTFLREARIY